MEIISKPPPDEIVTDIDVSFTSGTQRSWTLYAGDTIIEDIAGDFLRIRTPLESITLIRRNIEWYGQRKRTIKRIAEVNGRARAGDQTEGGTS